MSPRPSRSTTGQLPKRYESEEVIKPVVKRRTASMNSNAPLNNGSSSRSASMTPQVQDSPPSSISSHQVVAAKMPPEEEMSLTIPATATPSDPVRRGRGRPSGTRKPPTGIPRKRPLPAKPDTSRDRSQGAHPTVKNIKTVAARQSVRTPHPKQQPVSRASSIASTSKVRTKRSVQSPAPRNTTGPRVQAPAREPHKGPPPTPSPPPRKRTPPLEPLDDDTAVAEARKFTMVDIKSDYKPVSDSAWIKLSPQMKIIIINFFTELLSSFYSAATFLHLSEAEIDDYHRICAAEILRQKEEDRIIRAANQKASTLFMEGNLYDLAAYDAIYERLYKEVKVVDTAVTKREVQWGKMFVDERTRMGAKQAWVKMQLEDFVGVRVEEVNRRWGVDEVQ